MSLDIASLRPADTPEYMTPAWLGCVSWAITVPEIVDQFRTDTGNRWQPGRTGFERMIDEATGVDAAFLEAFTLWVNVNVWGPVDGNPDTCAAVGRS